MRAPQPKRPSESPNPPKKETSYRRTETPVREYAQALGVVLILVGAAGLVLGDRSPLGILNIFYVPKGDDIAHLLTGGLLVYLGFGQTDEGLARTAVVALGVVYLLVGMLGFVLPTLLELPSHGYSVGDDIIHLLIGILSLAIGFTSGRGTTSRA